MKEYLIVIAAPDERNLTPAEEQECITSYSEWARKLGETHVTARRLALTEGKIIRNKKDVITDGPFAEAKELIAGIIIIQTDTMLQAEKIADSCPLNLYFDLFVKEVN